MKREPVRTTRKAIELGAASAETRGPVGPKFDPIARQMDNGISDE